MFLTEVDRSIASQSCRQTESKSHSRQRRGSAWCEGNGLFGSLKGGRWKSKVFPGYLGAALTGKSL